MPAETWWATGWQGLPVWRIDLTGEVEEPLTAQYAGSLPSLREMLLRKGWRSPPPWTPVNFLSWLTTSVDAAALPVVPRLSNGELPDLTLILESGAALKESRLVLRLWAFDLDLVNGTPSPVWVGSVVEERLERPLSLFTLAFTQPAMNRPRDILAEALQSGRLVSRPGVVANADWDGRLLLVRERPQPMRPYL